MSKTAAQVLRELDGTHEVDEPKGLRQRYTAWAGGQNDPAFAYVVAVAKSTCGEGGDIGYVLYDLHVMANKGVDYIKHARLAKDWAYTEAARFVRSRPARSRVRGFALGWGHQACRDALFDVLWEHIIGTGLDARSQQFGVSRRQYQRVRDHIRKCAKHLLGNYRARLTVLNALDLAGYTGGTADEGRAGLEPHKPPAT